MLIPVLWLASLAPAALAQLEFTGYATVLDGDTLDMDGLRVRLFGVDAPEFTQHCARPDGASWACGSAARDALEARLGDRKIACEQKDVDIYRRSVAVCRLDGVDVNAWLVAAGWATAYREFSTDYVEAEATARAARLNLWNGKFQQPEEFRRQNSGPAAAGRNQRECAIKGNISTGGDRIYHVPGGRFYARTVISVARGERFFCSESEAQDAGWRASRQ